jgi:putative transposase
MEVKIGAHCAYNINYHIVFCPKRRRSILVGDIANDCKTILHEVANDCKIKIEAMEVMPDHIHVFVSAHPKISPYLLIKRFKGRASNILRKKYLQLSKLSSLWSGSYYVGTVGNVSESVVKMYIENQKGK